MRADEHSSDPVDDGPVASGALVRDVFVARQAIFDEELHVSAYELLFRDDAHGVCPTRVDPTTASLEVFLHGLMTIGLETLTAGKPAFVNVTRDLVLGDLLAVLPPEQFVFEVLEETPVDRPLRAALVELRAQGYRLALDDVVDDDPRLSLLDIVDIAKIDTRRTTAAARRRLIARITDAGVAPLAEKVETAEEVRAAFSAGCRYAQGFFLTRPSVETGRHARGFAAAHLAALHAVRQPEVDFAAVETAVQQDLVLAQRLLKYLNAAAFGWRRQITSVRHALTLLGQDGTRRWVTLAVLGLAAEGKPHELVVMACTRAQLCQRAGRDAGLAHSDFDLFTLGMFSLLDAVLDQPRDQALAGLPLSPPIRAALLGDRSPAADLLDLAVACERADWTRLAATARRLGLAGERVRACYLEALAAVSVAPAA
jgi:c-di-GMP-related signal transduction protein